MLLKLAIVSGIALGGALAVFIVHVHVQAPPVVQQPVVQPTPLRPPTADEQRVLSGLSTVAPHPQGRMH